VSTKRTGFVDGPTGTGLFRSSKRLDETDFAIRLMFDPKRHRCLSFASPTTASRVLLTLQWWPCTSTNLIAERSDDFCSSLTSRETKMRLSGSPYCIVRGCGQNVAAHDDIDQVLERPPAQNDPHARWL